MRLTLFALAFSVLANGSEPRHLELSDGSAEFEWLNASIFRILRTWHPNTAPKSPASLLLESSNLRVEIDPLTAAVNVKTAAGKPLANLAGPVRGPGKIILETRLAPGERVFGNTGAIAESPFLFTSAGYGQTVQRGLKYLVDVKPDRVRITSQGSDTIEYFFLYGPNPKEIFEQRRVAIPIPDTLPLRTVDLDHLTCEAVQQLNAESLAATFYAVNAGPRWESFLGAYIREIHDRGLPIFRPLLLQFPKTPEFGKQMSVTMFGDEIILAPKCAAPFTLPQGIWTDMKSGVQHNGRSLVELADDVTLFARNGTIVPLRLPDKVELHYFPKLGAEFFIFEPQENEYSQVHASEAGDFWRLEIESKVTRKYEWVLHHIGENPKRIPVEAKAGADNIINLPI